MHPAEAALQIITACVPGRQQRSASVPVQEWIDKLFEWHQHDGRVEVGPGFTVHVPSLAPFVHMDKLTWADDTFEYQLDDRWQGLLGHKWVDLGTKHLCLKVDPCCLILSPTEGIGESLIFRWPENSRPTFGLKISGLFGWIASWFYPRLSKLTIYRDHGEVEMTGLVGRIASQFAAPYLKWSRYGATPYSSHPTDVSTVAYAACRRAGRPAAGKHLRQATTAAEQANQHAMVYLSQCTEAGVCPTPNGLEQHLYGSMIGGLILGWLLEAIIAEILKLVFARLFGEEESDGGTTR